MTRDQSGQTNFWMIAFFIVFGFLFFLLGTYFPNFLKQRPAPTIIPSPLSSPAPETPTVVIPPTSSSLPTVVPPISDLELIRAAMAEKHGKPVGEVELTLSKNTGLHAQGSVRFSGEEGGGWFLAYKETTGWIIVQDGNGTVSCETIASYSFPTDMVPECVDKNGNLITR